LDEVLLVLLVKVACEVPDELLEELPAEAGAAATTSAEAPTAVQVFQRFARWLGAVGAILTLPFRAVIDRALIPTFMNVPRSCVGRPTGEVL
jgi:uncharacterized protein YceK